MKTKLHLAVTFAALVLLQRLKARFSSARRFFWSPALHPGVHDFLKSDVRRHLLEQVMVHRRSRHVYSAESQPDGTRDVQLLGLAHCRRSDPHQLRAGGQGGFSVNTAYLSELPFKRAARAEASTPINEKSNSASPIPTFGTPRNASPSAKSTPTVNALQGFLVY